MASSPQQPSWKQSLPAVLGAAIATVGVLALRALSVLEPLELKVYDQWLRWRSTAAVTDRILIVEVNEADIQQLKQYPIPDEVLIAAIAELQEYQPKVIGIDIFRDFPVPDRFRPPTDVLPSLGREMMNQPNTVIVCKVGQANEPDIAPPAGLLSNQVGFADIPIDDDGVVRRAILASEPEANARCNSPQSFALALAAIFLGTTPQGDNGLELGTARFRALTPNWGGYNNLDAAGFQILINYGDSPRPYETVSLTDVLTQRVLPSQVRDRAVLIGVTGSSSNDKFLTPLRQRGQGNPFTPGVMVQAAILEDLLATALDNRPPLWTWPQGAIALWIFGWSLMGAFIVLKGQRWLIVPLLATAGVSLGGLTFLLFLQSGWIPLVAPELGFVGAGVLMLAYRALGTSPRLSPSPPRANAVSVTPLAFVNDSPSTAPATLPSAVTDSVLLEEQDTGAAMDPNPTVLQPDTSIPFTPVTPTSPAPLAPETLLTAQVEEIPLPEMPQPPRVATNPTEMETFLVVEPSTMEQTEVAAPDRTAAPETQVAEAADADPTVMQPPAEEKPATALTEPTPTILNTAIETSPEPVSNRGATATPLTAADLPETQLSIPESLPPQPAATTSQWFTEVTETQVTLPEEAPASHLDGLGEEPSLPPEEAVASFDPDTVETQFGSEPADPDTTTPPTLLPASPPQTTDTMPPSHTSPSPPPVKSAPKTTVITDIEGKTSLPQILGGRYQVVSQLGEGGFGRTFLAADQHLPDHPICVVKQLVPSRNDERFLTIARRLFQREAQTLAQLGQHERIPRLLAYFEEGGVFYLTQEYVEGESLKEEFEKKITLSQSEAIAILKSILELLQYVHQLGVIHRDIKPANIMRRRSDQQLFLIDFGAVRHVQPEDLQKHGKYTISIGTRGYAPSEQMAGRPVIASDIYSLGMVIIEGLTGLAPMDLPNDASTGDVVWEPGKHLSPQFVAILNRMIKYNFRDRHQSASEVLEALAKAGLT